MPEVSTLDVIIVSVLVVAEDIGVVAVAVVVEDVQEEETTGDIVKDREPVAEDVIRRVATSAPVIVTLGVDVKLMVAKIK